jgi:hypothetical protein
MDELDNPGQFAASYSAGQSDGLPIELLQIPQDALLPTAGLQVPQQPSSDFADLGTDASFAPSSFPASVSGSSPAPIATTGGGVGDFASLLGPVLNEGFNALNGLVVNPAIAQANQSNQQQALTTQLQATAGQSAISTQSVTTIILWGAIAVALVILVGDVGKRV